MKFYVFKRYVVLLNSWGFGIFEVIYDEYYNFMKMFVEKLFIENSKGWWCMKLFGVIFILFVFIYIGFEFVK